jgi:hypothetical protein
MSAANEVDITSAAAAPARIFLNMGFVFLFLVDGVERWVL